MSLLSLEAALSPCSTRLAVSLQEAASPMSDWLKMHGSLPAGSSQTWAKPTGGVLMPTHPWATGTMHLKT